MNILMPQLGETVTEGTIISWHVAVGDTILPGDVLFDVDTDKTTMEVPATCGGSITEIRVPPGQVVPTGAVVAILMADGEVSAEVQMPDETVSLATAAVPAPTRTATSNALPIAERELDAFNAVRTPERNFGPAALDSGARVTPLARRLAAELGVSLAMLSGSGPSGRIVAKDVREFKPPVLEGSPSGRSFVGSGANLDEVRALYSGTPFAEVELDGMRRTIARRLLESKQTVPHFYLTSDVDIERMLELRRQINERRSEKISVNDFVVKAYALALMAFPAANAVWAEDRI